MNELGLRQMQPPLKMLIHSHWEKEGQNEKGRNIIWRNLSKSGKKHQYKHLKNSKESKYEDKKINT